METIKDIVADMRRGMIPQHRHDRELLTNYADRIEAAWEHTRKHSMYCTAHNCKLREIVESVTDCNQHETVDIESRCIYGEAKDGDVGNAAALREAAKATMKFLESAIVNGKVSVEDLSTLQNIVSKALSEPPRNCDVFKTKSEMRLAFIDWYNETFDLKGSNYAIDTCDLKHNVDGILHEYIDWLFAEAKGDAK